MRDVVVRNARVSVTGLTGSLINYGTEILVYDVSIYSHWKAMRDGPGRKPRAGGFWHLLEC